MKSASNTTLPEDGGAVLKPEWLRIPDAVRFSGIGRSRIYELAKSGAIRSASLRGPRQTKGTRLICRESLLAFIEKHATGGESKN